jgi:hypothetical protein
LVEAFIFLATPAASLDLNSFHGRPALSVSATLSGAASSFDVGERVFNSATATSWPSTATS